MDEDAHSWQPLSPEQVCELLKDLSIPWWMAGGWAIDLFAGRQTRAHADTDVLILRKDQLVIQEYLSDWDLHKTQQPGLMPWPRGEFLNAGVNDVWCRRTPESPWSLQLMFIETDGDRWVFRRDPSIGGPIHSLGRKTPTGIPYLASEIQLLYKARKEPLESDDADFEAAIPLMNHAARLWLFQCLRRRFPEGHGWLARLSEATNTGSTKN